MGHQLHAAGVIGKVDLAVFAVDAGLGIPGNADPINVVVFRVDGYQYVGVASAVAVVYTGDQNGVKRGLALVMGAESCRLFAGEVPRNRGVVHLLNHNGGVGFLVGRPEIDPYGGISQRDEDQEQQQGNSPGAAFPAAKS